MDAWESSHPISIPVKHPEEIREIFDGISYSKGASIIRMMDNFLTTQTFRQGLTNYLTALKFDAAEQDDLWHHLTVQGHKDNNLPLEMDVKTIMDTWTLQMGFPVLTVTRNYTSNTAKLNQKRFLIGKLRNKTDTKVYSWWIPLTFTGARDSFDNTYSKQWMKKGEHEMEISGMPARDTALVFNVQQTGYYRVNYDQQNWALLVEQLLRNHTAIHVNNRAQIIDDAFNLARANLLDYETALSVTEYLHKEVDYVPWNSALSGLAYIDTMLKRTPAYGDFKRFMLKRIEPIFTKLGFNAREDDTHLDILLRKQVVRWACSMGNKQCLEEAKENFNDWMKLEEPDMEEANQVDVNMKYETYCNAISNGGLEEWDFAWERYKKSLVASEKSALLSALGCTKEVWLLNRYLNMSFTAGSGVREQDTLTVLDMVSSNTVGRYLAFDFIREKLDEVSMKVKVFGDPTWLIISTIASSFNTEFELKQLREFVAAHSSDQGSSTRAVEKVMEAVEENLVWMEKNYKCIWGWLKTHNN